RFFIEDPPRISARLGCITPTLTLPRLRGRGHRRCVSGRRACYKAVCDVVRGGVGIALGRVAPASATARFEHQHVTWPDHQPDLFSSDRTRRLACGKERVAMRHAVGAAEDAAST